METGHFTLWRRGIETWAGRPDDHLAASSDDRAFTLDTLFAVAATYRALAGFRCWLLFSLGWVLPRRRRHSSVAPEGDW